MNIASFTGHRRRPRRHATVAREHGPGYRLGRADSDGRVGAGAATVDDPPPFELTVLAEVPALAAPLVALADADRLQTQAILAIAGLLEAQVDVAIEHTGVGLEHWLAIATGAPALDRRTWLRAARLLLRLPGLRQQVEDGHVTAGQLRGLSIALRGAPAEIDGPLDTWLADAAARLAELRAEPDALVAQARQAVAELTTQVEQLEEDANHNRFLHIQNRLDGSGGTFTGSEDAYGIAMLEAATRPRADQSADMARARADNLQAILHGASAPDVAGAADRTQPPACAGEPDAAPGRCAEVGTPPQEPPRETERGSEPQEQDVAAAPAEATSGWDGTGWVARSWAEAAAIDARYAEADAARDRELPSLAERIAGYADAGWRAPPTVLVRAELSTLLDRDQLPTDLLVALSGGRLRATSAAIRRLIDAHGAALRLVITDQGRVVGVGRRKRVAPGWLRETLLAVHDTSTGPLSARPAVGADADHAAAWEPDGDQPGGRTDLDNLGPLAVGMNRDRAASGWRPEQHDADGVRTWHHPRSGLTTTSIPATWRPPSRYHPPPTSSRSVTGPHHTTDPDDDLPF